MCVVALVVARRVKEDGRSLSLYITSIENGLALSEKKRRPGK